MTDTKVLDVQKRIFKSAKALLLLMVASLIITGFSGFVEPTLDSSSEEAGKASLERMKKYLSEENKNEFMDAYVKSFLIFNSIAPEMSESFKALLYQKIVSLLDGKNVNEIILFAESLDNKKTESILSSTIREEFCEPFYSKVKECKKFILEKDPESEKHFTDSNFNILETECVDSVYSDIVSGYSIDSLILKQLECSRLDCTQFVECM